MSAVSVKKLRGVLCPLATPWDYRGELYPAKAGYNVARLNRTRLAGYIVGSAAGEGPLLEPEERIRLFELVARHRGDGKRLIAEVSAESVSSSKRLAARAADSGYELALARPPRESWGDPDIRLGAYFQALADRSPLPLYLDLSGGSAVTPETVSELARHPCMVGAFAPPNADSCRRLLSDSFQAFDIVGASIEQLSALWDDGLRAAVEPLANAIPFHVLAIEEALRTREEAAASDLLARAEAAIRTIYPALGPAGLKHAMDLRGAFGGAPRLPGLPLNPARKADVERVLDGLAS